jgi:hypothetical protein
MQVQVDNPSAVPVSLTDLVLKASGSGLDDTGIVGVEAWRDADGDGLVDAGDNLLATSSYPSDNGAVTLSLINIITPASTAYYLVVYNFSLTASAGTYISGITAGGISGISPYGPINVTGLPIQGAIITIVEPTPTYTATLFITSTPTRTGTPTATQTPVPTATGTFTPPPTATFTSTYTQTPTATWTITGQFTMTATSTPTLTVTLPPGIDTGTIVTYAYPNPVSGNLLNFSVLLASGGTTNIRVYNAGGDLVAAYPLTGMAGSNVYTADISSYSHGIYYYLVESDGPSGKQKSKPEKFAVLRYP